jgi:hypothetical protein
MITEPILKLKDQEVVKALFKDATTGSILIGTSKGRILLAKVLGSNAYIAGNRTIYATRTNGMGVESESASINVRYGLIDKVVELTNGFAITRWKDVIGPAGAESYKRVSGIFTTPVLWAGEDFGWWGTASWSQIIGSDSRAIVAIRVAGSESALMSMPWKAMESTTSGMVSWPMDEVSIAGSYAQLRIVLESSKTEDNPSVSNLVLSYSSKHASYFFITKMSMGKGSSIKGGLLTASVVVPRNTEVKWGVVGSNSANWNDYVAVTPDKWFDLSDGFGDRLKVGVKLISYDDERAPTVDEFAIAFDSDADNLINKD